MLAWVEKIQRDQAGTVLSESYQTQLPHWGEASVRSRIHHPGKMFLDCLALGIEMYPLGRVVSTDALDPAETVLLQMLKQHAEWCLEAMVAIGSAKEVTDP